MSATDREILLHGVNGQEYAPVQRESRRHCPRLRLSYFLTPVLIHQVDGKTRRRKQVYCSADQERQDGTVLRYEEISLSFFS
ncbi:hypothetical protein [Paenibacillus sp. MER TA 81-3]|uniref:hypothetical protein n=1 Tax=Paenibacillus sp. MER TA 81-3 TaxID=2939573 RepID=UPI002041AD88|nr:hypothetical protein [Paenibacillus sp. MER TA 81-3]